MTHKDRPSNQAASQSMVYAWGEIREQSEYILVKMLSLPTEELALECIRTMDNTLVSSRLRKLLIDSREIAPPTPAINDLFWQWTRDGVHHNQLALVVRSDMKSVESNMRALASRAKLRSFHSIREAEQWLRAAPQPRRSRGS